MDIEAASELLAEVKFPMAPITPIHGGWASWTFDLAGSHILRVSRRSDIDAAHQRETRLLPVLAQTVNFAVPVPIRFGWFRGRRYMIYAKLPGRAMRSGDEIEPVADMLRQLHDFPVARAAALVRCGPTSQAWHQDYLDSWTWIARDVLPLLDSSLRDQVTNRYKRMLPQLAQITPVLVHRDLGTEHIRVAAGTNTPHGIIDFETATVGDAAIDFVGILITLGEAATERVIAAYGGSICWARLWFYWWIGAVHAIHHGVVSEDASIVADGIAGLRQRIDRLREVEGETTSP